MNKIKTAFESIKMHPVAKERVWHQTLAREKEKAEKCRRPIRWGALVAALCVLILAGGIATAAATGAIDVTAIWQSILGQEPDSASVHEGITARSNGIELNIVSVVADTRSIYAIGYAQDTEGDGLAYFTEFPSSAEQRLGTNVEGSGIILLDADGNEKNMLGITWGMAFWPASEEDPGVVPFVFWLGEDGTDIESGDSFRVYITAIQTHIENNTWETLVQGNWILEIPVPHVSQTRSFTAERDGDRIELTVSPISVDIVYLPLVDDVPRLYGGNLPEEEWWATLEKGYFVWDAEQLVITLKDGSTVVHEVKHGWGGWNFARGVSMTEGLYITLLFDIDQIASIRCGDFVWEVD